MEKPWGWGGARLPRGLEARYGQGGGDIPGALFHVLQIRLPEAVHLAEPVEVAHVPAGGYREGVAALEGLENDLRSMLADPIRATSSTVLIQCCSQINSAFSRYPFFYALFQRPGALDVAACLDAILAGVVLVVGMTAGLHLATRLMSTWRSWTARVDFGEG